MAKKKPGMSPKEQVEKFHETVRELVVAGDINPTEADDAFERALAKTLTTRKAAKAPDAS